MPQSAEYERLPMYASSSHSRPARNRLLTSSPPIVDHLDPRSRSRPRSPKPSTSSTTRRRNVCHLFTLPGSRTARILKYILSLAVLFLLYLLYLYEPHIELAFYSRPWIKQEIHKLEPLSGTCFDPERVSSRYNVSEYVYGPKKMEVQAGLSLKLGMDCYNFAGTIQSSSNSQKHLSTTSAVEKTVFHTYWRVDLAPFGHRQEWMIKGFFATQNLDRSQLIMWSNGDLSENKILQEYLQRYPHAFALKVVDISKLARGTALEGSNLLQVKDRRAWLDGDLIRLLLLWNYGGVWVDMDSLFTRNFEPLLEHEFVTQWDCYDKPYSPFNGALLRFRQHSPYLCEAFHIMATSTPPRPKSTDWGAVLYLKLWRRLVTDGIPPFQVLPFCFNDGRSCRLDNRLPDPFTPDRKDGRWTEGMGVEEGGGLDKVLQKIFAVHLHNQWEKDFPEDGWVDRLLLRRYDEILRLKKPGFRA